MFLPCHREPLRLRSWEKSVVAWSALVCRPSPLSRGEGSCNRRRVAWHSPSPRTAPGLLTSFSEDPHQKRSRYVQVPCIPLPVCGERATKHLDCDFSAKDDRGDCGEASAQARRTTPRESGRLEACSTTGWEPAPTTAAPQRPQRGAGVPPAGALAFQPAGVAASRAATLSAESRDAPPHGPPRQSLNTIANGWPLCLCWSCVAAVSRASS
jgi:hypothetical protein